MAASDAGVEPSEMAAQMNAAHAGHAGAVVDRLGPHDPDGFSAWAASQMPTQSQFNDAT